MDQDLTVLTVAEFSCRVSLKLRLIQGVHILRVRLNQEGFKSLSGSLFWDFYMYTKMESVWAVCWYNSV